jgi:rhamnogalacturonyl hydrolase YesR
LFASSLLLALAASPVVAAERWDVGLTTSGARIEAAVVHGPSVSSPTVLLIGGLQGKDESVDIVAREVAAFDAIPQTQRRFRLLSISLANPDGELLQFPPTGTAYRENIESHVLWRWIGVHAPDLVVTVGPVDFSLSDALSRNAVANVGSIPARRVEARLGIMDSLPAEIGSSDARLEIERRRNRSPRELAEELAKVYGHDLDQPTYIPALAVIGRLRLGHTEDVIRLTEPYLDGSVDSLARPSQGALAGHMVFFELAKRTGDKRAVERVLGAADIGFNETGDMREFMPLHGGWSDSVFMDIPILAKAGALTGERKYFDMAARHLSFMHGLVLRPDGLYRHQVSTDAAWGRGNAFPALGLALTLSDFPKDHADYNRVLEAFQQHMKTLAKFQDEHGMWRQVVDHPGAYPEYSATAMIATAMLRGVRNGWLEFDQYQPLVDKAWLAILSRTGSDGAVVDVCEGTGTRGLTYNDYIRRAAILGRDPRAGAMALLFSTEMAGLQ